MERDKALAQALYQQKSVDKSIPRHLFAAIARRNTCHHAHLRRTNSLWSCLRLGPDRILRRSAFDLVGWEVVVLKDAFRPEFAEMVYQELAAKDVPWSLNEAYFNDGYHHHHHNASHHHHH